jgi:hypothetical protein
MARKKIKLSNTSKDFKEWNGRKVKDVLDHLSAGGLPGDVTDALAKSMPEIFNDSPLDEIFLIADVRFPTPFLKLELGDIGTEDIQHLDRHYRGGGPAFRELKPKSDSIKILRQSVAVHNFFQNNPMSRLLVLGEVDLSAGKTKVVEAFKKWLDDLPQLKQFKIPQGKAAALPWHELKELAAYRLARIGGLSYAAAIKEAKALQKAYPGDSNAVLPTYNTLGAYSEAVAAADKRILRLFPPPHRSKASG